MATLQDWEYSKWTVSMAPLFTAVIFLGLEILAHLVPAVCDVVVSERIPIKGKHLDNFDKTDRLYIFINKCITVVFTYHVVQVAMNTPSIQWSPSEVTLFNTLGSLVCFYVFYDFFYTNFHGFLHVRWLYPYIHKHHHRQKAPSRGNPDAINVHPFEFFVGEYLRLLTIYFIPCHIYTVAFFILIGGILASLNHTRYDISWGPIFNVNVHDVHHRLPESNYGQYTMLWDYLLGSYRPYGSKLAMEAKDE
jgi:sterol desaturase/sphingolipid hydroxylase (fatty acid hydroxylase superfamily)